MTDPAGDADPVEIEEDVPQGRINVNTPDKAERAIQRANDNLRLVQRRWFATVAGIISVLQVMCADAVFIVYAIALHWHVPTPAIQAWLAATVVQVIGVVLVITRSLFPAYRHAGDVAN